jgi:hypothetical protein
MFTSGAGTFTFVHCTRVCVSVCACVHVCVRRAWPPLDSQHAHLNPLVCVSACVRVCVREHTCARAQCYTRMDDAQILRRASCAGSGA